MSRQFIYDTLLGVGSNSEVEDRVFQRGSMLTAQVEKPYIVYGMGNNTDEAISSASDVEDFQPNRQYFQVNVYDLVGDYSRIDDILQQIKDAFKTASLSGDVCGVTYLETSQDFDDPTLESIMRYMRFQLAKAR